MVFMFAILGLDMFDFVTKHMANHKSEIVPFLIYGSLHKNMTTMTKVVFQGKKLAKTDLCNASYY